MTIIEYLKFMFIIILLSSCAYQEELGPLFIDGTQEIKPFDCSKNRFGTLNDNLDLYYKKFVKKVKSDDSFDTRVDYQTMLKLKMSKDQGYKELRCSIFNHIKKEKLDDVSQDYLVAFYLNAYNFLMMDVVIQVSNESLIKSVADIGGKNSFRVFGPKTGENPVYPLEVAGEITTLDKIENSIVRPILKNCDGRIHFAFICASIGCPILLPRAYREDLLQEQLNDITTKGLLLPRIFSNTDSKTSLSQIFNWYGEDMICEGRANNPELSEALAIKTFIQKYSIQDIIFHENNYKNWIHYDWNLNKI